MVTDRELGIPAIGLWIGREEWLEKNRATAEKFMVALETSVESLRAHILLGGRIHAVISTSPPSRINNQVAAGLRSFATRK